MLRSSTAAALAGVLLTAGLAAAQQPPSKPADGEQVMMLNKDGQAPRRCKVLRTWKHPSGGMAYEVKAEDTGEGMTVIENVPAGSKAGGEQDAPPAKPADPILSPT